MTDGILKLVLKDIWYKKIDNGIKKCEYREYKDFWIRRLYPFDKWKYVEFQNGYRKNPPKMFFEIKSIEVLENGIKTDLRINGPVFRICLGNRTK